MFETTIKWHKTSKELPKESGRVLILFKTGEIYGVHYSNRHKAFNAYDEIENSDNCFPTDEIICWASENEIVNQINSIANGQTTFDYQSVINSFNSTCISLPKIQKLTESRKKRIKSAYKQLENIKFEEFFKRVESSDFLTGRSGIWTGCSFDWILKPSNLTKIIEGNYDNKPVKSKKQPSFAKMEQKPSYDIEELERSSYFNDI